MKKVPAQKNKQFRKKTRGTIAGGTGRGRVAGANSGRAEKSKVVVRKKVVGEKVHKKAKRVRYVAKQTVLPTQYNGGHPYLLRYYGLIAVLVLVVLVQVFYSCFIDGRVLGDRAEITQAKLTEETNSERVKLGLQVLNESDVLAAAATAKARDMLERGYWSHNAPDGTKPWYWMESVGYRYEEAGENLARGFNTAQGILAAWMGSPSHRENVLDAGYTEVGFAVMNGIMDGNSTTLVVAMYARPLDSAAAVLGDYNASTQEGVVEISGEGLLVKLRRGFQSLTPSLMFVLAFLGIVMMLSIFAHMYRKRLPIGLRKEWHKHHVLYELVMVVVMGLGAVFSYGGGMI